MLRNVLSCVVESNQGRTLFAEVLVDDFRDDDLLFFSTDPSLDVRVSR
jgi:hypothetical protein